jgi:hypothetical protein
LREIESRLTDKDLRILSLADAAEQRAQQSEGSVQE